MDAVNHLLMFHTNILWLSSRNVTKRVFEVGGELKFKFRSSRYEEWIRPADLVNILRHEKKEYKYKTHRCSEIFHGQDQKLDEKGEEKIAMFVTFSSILAADGKK